MYSPKVFQEKRPEVLFEWIRRYPFGVLVTSVAGQMHATHLPFYLESGTGPMGRLVTHMARANPHWKLVEAADENLVIFSGPHAYISPSWYEQPNSVPTWNYLAVHARGLARVDHRYDGQVAAQKTLAQFLEKDGVAPWSLDQLPEAELRKNLRQIAVIQIDITALDGKKKLSQNKPEAVRNRVTAQLNKGQADGEDPVAKLMQDRDLMADNG